MEGGEVTIYPELLQMASKGRFKQMAIHGHVWSEENENFRQIYWSLRQLQNYGYSQRIGLVDLPRYDAVYERK
ncbi:hypothetical protein GCK32_021628 [Trichostrongylus colubriformis]|uniref:Uncharacterized protein n=1 Tax=Trichostrongylus colubriformis TaxID=6319 RepID=A0AAN8INB8_TRICO